MDVISCSHCQRTPALVQDIRGCHQCQSNGQASRVHAQYRDDHVITNEIAKAVGLVVVQQPTDELPAVVANEFNADDEVPVWVCPVDGEYSFRGETLNLKRGEVVAIIGDENHPWPVVQTSTPADTTGDHAGEKAPVTPNPDADPLTNAAQYQQGAGQRALEAEAQTEGAAGQPDPLTSQGATGETDPA